MLSESFLRPSRSLYHVTQPSSFHKTGDAVGVRSGQESSRALPGMDAYPLQTTMGHADAGTIYLVDADVSALLGRYEMGVIGRPR